MSARARPVKVTLAHLQRAALRLRAQQLAGVDLPGSWPAVYRNAETGRVYTPHTDDEAWALRSDTPRRLLARGGEGSGKSVFGVIKDLERVRRGMSGIVGSPDYPHFSKSLWPEFRRWCPWNQVIARQRYRQRPEWDPGGAFALTFLNGAQILFGGFETPGSWEGPNVTFAHFDEARRHKTADMLKVLDGRVRIPGPRGEPPQLWLTTTPRKHWLHEYFGPVVADDPFADFKAEAADIILRMTDNAANLDPAYVRARRQSLTAQEARVLVDAEWEDLADSESFLASIILWDTLAETLPPLTPREPLTFAADAGVSNDSFALVGVGAHPTMRGRVAVRVVREWVPPKGGSLDFDEIEAEIRLILRACNAVHLAYDPYQLHQMAGSLERAGIVPVKAFNQGVDRLVADKQLHDLILTRRLAHDGDLALRAHVQHADRLYDSERTRFRIVKREEAQKIDLAVALSMACARHLGPPIDPRDVVVPAGARLGGIVVGVGGVRS